MRLCGDARRGWTGADDDDGDDGAGTSPRSQPLRRPRRGLEGSGRIWKSRRRGGRRRAARRGTPPRVPVVRPRRPRPRSSRRHLCRQLARRRVQLRARALHVPPATPPRLRSGGVSSNDDDSGLSVTLVAPPAAAPTPQSRSGSSSSAGSQWHANFDTPTFELLLRRRRKAAGSSPQPPLRRGHRRERRLQEAAAARSSRPPRARRPSRRRTPPGSWARTRRDQSREVALSAICGVEKKNPPFWHIAVTPSSSSPSLAAFDSKRAEGKEGSSLGERSMRRIFRDGLEVHPRRRRLRVPRQKSQKGERPRDGV